MAIQFARSERISRSKGGNAVRSAAYALREKLLDERTGETHKFKDDGTLQHSQILLPHGADPKFLDPASLFNAIEGAERRKDAQVAQHVVVALDPNITAGERIDMAHGFAKQLFVDRGKPVLVCVHVPHTGENPHAHLIGGTRRLGPDGFAAHKDRETAFARIRGRAAFIIKSERERVGELWRDFQNAWFSANGKTISVDPVAPVPSEHLGPKRFQHPQDHRLKTAEEIRALNTNIARNPEAVAAHLSQQHRFDSESVSSLLSKYIVDPEEREAVAADVRTRLHNLQREALVKASWSDNVASGLRALSVEDVARELSPKYARLLQTANELREEARRADWIKRQQTADKEAGEYRVKERWSEMGVARRAMHMLGASLPSLAALRDIELDRWSSLSKQGAWAERRWSIRGAAISGGKPGAPTGNLPAVTREAAEELEKIRPEAERILAARKKIAANARNTLEILKQQDKLSARARRSYSRGPPL